MRHFYRTTALDNTGEWLLPVLEPAESVDHVLRLGLVRGTGQDGAFDVYGDLRAPREPARATLEFILSGDTGAEIQTAIAAMRAGLGVGVRSGGRRKLWSREADDTDPRWAYCKASVVDIPKRREMILHLPASAELVLPDPTFYDPVTSAYLTGEGFTVDTLAANVVGEPIAPDLDFARITASSGTTNFTLTNEGPVETRFVIFRLASQAANGFTNPKIVNNTTGQSVESTTDGLTANTVLSINCGVGLGRARVSTDGGLDWVDDTQNLILGSTQAVLMELLPGANSFTFTSDGTVDTHLLCWWASGYSD